MGALPKRRISTARRGKRRADKNIELAGRGLTIGSRARREAKKTAAKAE